MHSTLSSDFYLSEQISQPVLWRKYVQKPPIANNSVIVVGTNSYCAKYELGSFADSDTVNQLMALKAMKVQAATDRWQRFVTDPSASSDVDTLTETAEGVLDYVANYGPQALTLSGLKANSVQCEHLATVLRATSIWRASIPGWDQALQTAIQSVESTGQDVADVLFGMV